MEPVAIVDLVISKIYSGMAMRKIQSPKPEIIRAIQIKKSFYFEAYASDTPAFQNPKNINVKLSIYITIILL